MTMKETMKEIWVSIEPEVWKPENEGDSIEGIVVDKKPKTEVLSAQIKLKNDDGEHLIWGSAVLDDRMAYVEIGQKVRITFKENTTNKKGQDLKIFQVEVAEEVPEGTSKVKAKEEAVEDSGESSKDIQRIESRSGSRCEPASGHTQTLQLKASVLRPEPIREGPLRCPDPATTSITGGGSDAKAEVLVRVV